MAPHLPQHVAIIMDGNRRWAKANGFNAAYGHKKGSENIEKILESAIKLNICNLTLFAFSSENWNRSKSEVAAILLLVEEYLEEKMLNKLIEKNVRVRFIGDIQKFSDSIRKKINIFENKTVTNKYNLFIAINYGARAEIVNAVKKIVQFEIKADKIDEKLFSEYLFFKDTPEPDLLIRTGGEQRLSNFLLWHLAYSELYFCKKMWPDFSEEDFCQAINDYQLRDRRYGFK